MNTLCHCSRGKPLRVVKHSAGWLIPGALLALLPKCPLCLAAWLSVVLGLGVSAGVARLLHGTLTILCIAFIALHLARHLIRKSTTSHL